MAKNDRRSVVVTGASSGIGRATAVRLAQAEFEVFAGVRNEEDAESLRHAAPGIRPVRIDVTSAASIAAAEREVSEGVGGAGLDGLVNNAGIGVVGPTEYLPVESVRKMFEVNVLGAIAVTQAFLPLLRRAVGRIVNIGSVGDRFSPPFGGALSGSKSALRSIDESLRVELRPWGIRVCLIQPSAIASDAVNKVEKDAERLIHSLPPEGERLYGSMLRSFLPRAMARERNGSPPEAVADVVLRALTARSPKARYPVGRDSVVLRNLPRLPDRALDALLSKAFSFPKAASFVPSAGRRSG